MVEKVELDEYDDEEEWLYENDLLNNDEAIKEGNDEEFVLARDMLKELVQSCS